MLFCIFLLFIAYFSSLFILRVVEEVKITNNLRIGENTPDFDSAFESTIFIFQGFFHLIRVLENDENEMKIESLL